MAKGASTRRFKLTKWRIEHGILTADLLLKYRIAVQFQKELAENRRIAEYYIALGKASNKMDYTHLLRDALDEVGAAVPPRRIAGRPVVPADFNQLERTAIAA